MFPATLINPRSVRNAERAGEMFEYLGTAPEPSFEKYSKPAVRAPKTPRRRSTH